MEKYKNYLENKFEMWQMVIAVLCAIVVAIVIIAEMTIPVDFSEIENHYAQLETVKQDVTSIYKLEDADISIDGEGMTVKFNGKYHHLKAYFDENKNYINAIVEDNRVGSNIVLSIFVVIIAGWFAYLATYLLLAILCIPILIHRLIEYIKKKRRSKNAK